MAESKSNKTTQKERTHDEAVDQQSQPLISHLIALRSSLLRSLIAVVVLFVPFFVFNQELYTYAAAPLLPHLGDDLKQLATEVASPFLVPFKLAIFLAIFTAIPYILHQAWRFIAPGLYLKEKRFAAPLLISSVILFYLGIAFAYFLVFPLVFQFLGSVVPEYVTWATDINSYLSFVIKLSLAFGFVFEIPIAIFLLVLTGFTTPKSLKRKRPYIFVACFAVGTILTPPDPLSQVLLAIPAWLLFEIGLILAKFIPGVSDQEES